MAEKKQPKSSILLKLPPRLKFGIVSTIALSAMYYQITTMYEYQKVLQKGPQEEIRREARIGNYEGPRVKTDDRS
jgi:hypothetical protein